MLVQLVGYLLSVISGIRRRRRRRRRAFSTDSQLFREHRVEVSPKIIFKFSRVQLLPFPSHGRMMFLYFSAHRT